jgi:hypothetical protein
MGPKNAMLEIDFAARNWHNPPRIAYNESLAQA